MVRETLIGIGYVELILTTSGDQGPLILVQWTS